MVLIGLQEALLTYQEDRAFSALIKLLFEPNKNIHVPSRLSKTEDVVIALLASVEVYPIFWTGRLGVIFPCIMQPF